MFKPQYDINIYAELYARHFEANVDRHRDTPSWSGTRRSFAQQLRSS